ncbi:type I-E CRISPR-associated protein Cse2/CasB [Salipiger sp.]|uniref:type I-E CRISPR-associated protein Cse2/CasB n=1 Tax=Salipiger sp. TaxID=2078585 RepID=UPI003A984574
MSDPDDRTARCALSIAAALAAAGPGEKAEARRMDERGAPVFWRHAARLGISPSQEASWLQFTRMVALMTPATVTTSIHSSADRVGAVLATAGLSEQRLARLLAARGEARLEALERAIRMVSRKHHKIDVVGLARAVLGQGGNALARDYYRDHAQNEPEEDAQNG